MKSNNLFLKIALCALMLLSVLGCKSTKKIQEAVVESGYPSNNSEPVIEPDTEFSDGKVISDIELNVNNMTSIAANSLLTNGLIPLGGDS